MAEEREGRSTGGDPTASPDKQTRAERLADALRTNLKRRKDQARGRRSAPADGRGTDRGESAS